MTDASRERAPAEDAVPAPPGPADDHPLQAFLDELREATDRLVQAAERLSDAEARGPSRLPGWTRGHVLTHLARHADATGNLITWVRTGVETPMYPHGREGRDADIDSGASRPSAELVADVRTGAEQLQAALGEVRGEALERTARTGTGLEVRGRDLPLLRIRELEIHHVDLGVGYTPAHWSTAFATRTLDQVAPFFRTERVCPVRALHGSATSRTWEVGAAGPAVTGPEAALLGWLVGRADGDGLTTDTGAPVPPAPSWL
ncbi:MAG: maleylpyruvate isomerase family mycothiol-dependent enzyme [Actinomycetota bacterium]|nr:maleylpyruvate isomerase family mycothiol-dependent enzyme [Actinomycetota bacterium]